MINNVLTIKTGKKDLPILPEYWTSAKFDEKKQELDNLFFTKTGVHIYTSSKPIREICFLIKKSTSINHLLELSKKLKNKFGISCFQASIDRTNNTAHLLFTWIDKEGKSIVLNNTDQIKMSVYILSFLSLPRPKSTSLWIRYFLQYSYELYPNIFDITLEELDQLNLDGKIYTIIRDSLIFAQLMCTGDLK